MDAFNPTRAGRIECSPSTAATSNGHFFGTCRSLGTRRSTSNCSMRPREHVFVYAKIQPVIEEVRALFGNPDFLRNLETLVKRIPDSEEKIVAMRERMKKFAEMRAERTAKGQATAAAS